MQRAICALALAGVTTASVGAAASASASDRALWAWPWDHFNFWRTDAGQSQFLEPSQPADDTVEDAAPPRQYPVLKRDSLTESNFRRQRAESDSQNDDDGEAKTGVINVKLNSELQQAATITDRGQGQRLQTAHRHGMAN
mmetsp:Transcript_38394/g.105754  ORF Transcript_38394/g.105754 Transcript_38394/m.105754 type:complete len:140 (+) Transcript_38394:98-517(+)|eukprot:CAMPEP_0117513972 /NCGR_PEP_ID=MMETSP0784-20121206/29831_1 /TAXON_ID=39447 /ORGANISM="" /LENGTH=139 /DNA_ID=CAMNT_0005309757 /DNA_START=74 /DNA_END=493 /DNA_ORIENTATION=+